MYVCGCVVAIDHRGGHYNMLLLSMFIIRCFTVVAVRDKTIERPCIYNYVITLLLFRRLLIAIRDRGGPRTCSRRATRFPRRLRARPTRRPTSTHVCGAGTHNAREERAASACPHARNARRNTVDDNGINLEKPPSLVCVSSAMERHITHTYAHTNAHTQKRYS